MTTIHSTAIVEKGARIGNGVAIGPYSVIGPSVVIGDNVVIKSHVVIDGHTIVDYYLGQLLEQRPMILNFAVKQHSFLLGKSVKFVIVISNNATLAGNVIIEDCAVIGGISAVNQHGYSSSTIHILMSAFRKLYRSHLPMKEALYKIRSDIEQTDEVLTSLFLMLQVGLSLKILYIKEFKELECALHENCLFWDSTVSFLEHLIENSL
ncbi:hypothetical protein ACTFIW_000825 [Dictyostelium discoideum]